MTGGRPLYPILPEPWTVRFTRGSDGITIVGVAYADGTGMRVPLSDVRAMPVAASCPWLDEHGTQVPAPGQRVRKRPVKGTKAQDTQPPVLEPVAAPEPAPAIVEPVASSKPDHEAQTGIDSGECDSVVREVVGCYVHVYKKCSGPGCTTLVRANGGGARKTCSPACRSARQSAVAKKSNAARRGRPQRRRPRALAVHRPWPWWKRAWGNIISAITWWRTR